MKFQVLLGVASSLVFQVDAHGYAVFPKARQTFCYEDGTAKGWFNNFESEPCQQAFDISGTYPFIQQNKFAANVIDFNNQQAVEAMVPDGHLCSGGDSRKAGVDILSADWKRDKLAAGETFTYRLRATAPHNPSFWKFYISKPSYDTASSPLSWSDLEPLADVGNVPVQDGYYYMDLQMPSDRPDGSLATIFTRWQRDDAAGEGFYMCSDVVITGGSSPSPTPSPSSSSTTTTTTPATTTSTSTTTSTTSSFEGGQCTGDPCANTSFCRSKWGFCGSSSDYCNAESIWTPSCTSPSTTTTPVPTTSTTTSSTTSTTTTTTTTTAFGGQCGGDPCNNSSFCRSKWGFCGASSAYCNAESVWTPSCGSSPSSSSEGSSRRRLLRGQQTHEHYVFCPI
uniref:Chitin-binding type-1 domain-containing protein n=1 Tax=Chromera velia CCMP2878 TaxID=1169474 RepID=A0A0G4GK73_9ALVE|eukprot:Cvel_22258.t1-p1 / transcript=Cvel_22258.t1 / gene=Cvel_22258 / organism=Chromera_velia_CCMP2878 / gene_product=Spindolin, putative / transcript_product=Spindolin, putative / location=Cvel_scaffold2170:5617-6798(+) / protein_length=394 / sequence_SO=supercontig / SO=protein_coding / is_pseudo=false